VRWIPPRTLPAREQWARENRWVAGLYFGLLLSAFMTVWYWSRWPEWYAIAGGILTWPFATIGFAAGIRRRWGQRPEPDRYPIPTRRRPWTRASDRFLMLALLIGIAGGLTWALGTVRGDENLAIGSLVTAGCAWFVATAWSERRRRASGAQSGEDPAR